jgi:hypothetical protein
MTDDPSDEIKGSDDRPNKRPPPTIDLEASEVSGDTQASPGNGEPRASRFTLATILPPLAGALAALVVMGILWAAGVIGSEPQPQQAATVPPAVTSGLNDLSDRIGKVETKLSSTPPTDSALRARVDALETAANTLRDQTAALRKQVDAAAVALSELKSTPPRAGDAAPDLTALTERLARLEQAVRALPDKPQAVATASDDIRPRRLVIATVLETKVRRGEPYVAALAAAKAVAADKAVLTPLDASAETGVPTDAMLAKELQALLPQLMPAAPAAAPAESKSKSGLLDQLASSVSKLVRVERVDAPERPSLNPNAQPQSNWAVVLQADVGGARTQLEKLPPDLKAKAQPWLDRVNARDAALKAVAAFSSSALAALSKAD